MKQFCGIQLLDRAISHGQKIALVTGQKCFSYSDLNAQSSRVASTLLDKKNDLFEQRVAFITPPGFDYIATQWGVWKAGGVAIPLCVLYPIPELEYAINDADPGIIVAHPEFIPKVRAIGQRKGIRVVHTTDLYRAEPQELPKLTEDRRAMMLYTSGTTGRPKGVVTTHANIRAQVSSLVEAWEWTERDYILNVLPLHHLHGILAVLSCALWSGATCELLPGFEAARVWERFLHAPITLFMGVPTIYSKLINHWEAAKPEDQKSMTTACAKLRLMVCGSAALPVPVLEKWKKISGHVLLERYGMTEFGMALSNPLHGEHVPAHVGSPLPSVKVRLVDEEGNEVSDGKSGEIQVKGPNVFQEYWRKPQETKRAFRDGWFCTGDIAVKGNGIFRILGRNSVDMIKTGGYKVSALEIEQILLTHPSVDECAVVALEDPEWGERVCAAIRLRREHGLTLDSLRAWCKDRIAVYKIPSRLLLVDKLPVNALGKVTKPAVVQMFASHGRSKSC